MAKNLQDKLDKLRSKMASVASGGAGFWSPPEGESIIRILPPVGGMEFFFQEVGTHKLPDNTILRCPKFTSDNELDCPICEAVSQLYNGSEEDQKFAKQLLRWKQYWMNIVVRDKGDKEGKTGSGPKIFTPGVTVFSGLMALVNGELGDISKVGDREGVDIIITKYKENNQTKYMVNAARYDCPLHQDDAQVEKWLEEAEDLSYVVLSEDPDEDEALTDGAKVVLYPYARLKEMAGIGSDAPKQTTSAMQAKANLRRSTTEPDEEEDDEPDEEAFPAEEEDEVGAAIEASKSRRRRRFSR